MTTNHSVKHPTKLPGTIDGGFAPKTPTVKPSSTGVEKGFAPKTPSVIGESYAPRTISVKGSTNGKKK